MPKRILSNHDLRALLGVSRSTIWRLVRRGILPEPIEVSTGRKGWPSDEIDAWIDQRKAARRGPHEPRSAKRRCEP